MITTVILGTAAMLVLLGFIIHNRYIHPALVRYESRLLNFSILVKERHPKAEMLKAEWLVSTHHNEHALAAQKNLRNMPFPIPDHPADRPTEEMLSELVSLFQENPAYAAGIEQAILMLLPPEQLLECFDYTLTTIVDHAAGLSLETLATLKQSLADAAVNIQDSEILLRCVKSFLSAFAEQMKDPDHLHSFLEALQHKHFELAGGMLFNWHTIKAGLDPLLNLNHHLDHLHDSAIHHTADTLHSVGDHAATHIHVVAGSHFPFITVFMSSRREILLLQDDKTNWQTAVKNLGYDVAGTGGGAFAGAKVGAMAGTFFGPVGTVVGGVLGAIGGAFGGRKLSNHMKEQPMRDAIDAYLNTAARMGHALKAAAATCLIKLREKATQAQGDFIEEAGAAPLFDIALPHLTACTNSLLESRKSDIDTCRQKFKRFERSLFAFIPRNRKLIRMNQEEINRLVEGLGQADSASGAAKIEAIGTAPYLIGGAFEQACTQETAKLRQVNTEMKGLFTGWTLSVAMLYQKYLKVIATELQEQAQDFSTIQKDWQTKMKSYENGIRVEREKLGLT